MLHLSSVYISYFHWCLLHYSYYHTSWTKSTCACVNCFYCLPCKIKIVILSYCLTVLDRCIQLEIFLTGSTMVCPWFKVKVVSAMSPLANCHHCQDSRRNDMCMYYASLLLSQNCVIFYHQQHTVVKLYPNKGFFLFWAIIYTKIKERERCRCRLEISKITSHITEVWNGRGRSSNSV